MPKAKTTEEVANKVRTEMTKEKLLKQFKDYIGEKEFRIFSNANQTLKSINHLGEQNYDK